MIKAWMAASTLSLYHVFYESRSHRASGDPPHYVGAPPFSGANVTGSPVAPAFLQDYFVSPSFSISASG